ncbi:MAG: AraC family transcriptional regulator, transcriptional activator FtrA [Actinomycetota bacterium]|nr:AraC family transcriptional regulator, transcriptional activator FtrA [Actinomycetota bacterium]
MANSSIMPRSRPHLVVALGYPGMAPFELSVVIEVFGLARPELDVPRWYALDVCAVVPGPQQAVGGISIDVPHGLDRIARADTLIIPGWPVHQDVPDTLVAAVRRAHRRGARVVSICSGAFVLAASGLLAGRRAATHWQYADLLAAKFPDVTVDRDVLYIDDGDVLTSAGSAAGIDLCLHLVRRDHGAAIANHVARRLVVPAHRDGGQAQYVERPVAADGDTRIHEVIDWMGKRLGRPVTVSALARRASMSDRHFARRFREVTGQAPLAWLIGQRIDASLEQLERGDRSIDEIATSVGFANAITYRHHFRQRLKTAPSTYRRAFRD